MALVRLLCLVFRCLLRQSERNEVRYFPQTNETPMVDAEQNFAPLQKSILKQTTLKMIGIMQVIFLCLSIIFSVVLIILLKSVNPLFDESVGLWAGLWAGFAALPGTIFTLILAFQKNGKVFGKSVASIIFNKLGMAASGMGAILSYVIFMKTLDWIDDDDDVVVQALVGTQMILNGLLAFFCFVAAIYSYTCCCGVTTQNGYLIANTAPAPQQVYIQTTATYPPQPLQPQFPQQFQPQPHPMELNVQPSHTINGNQEYSNQVYQ